MKFSWIKSKEFITPTIVAVIFVVIYLIMLQVGEVKYYSLMGCLTQWDAQHYLSISRDGYEKFPCLQNPDYICGNVGWFPFYPLMGRIIGLTGIGAGWAMVITSWLALWGAMILLYRLVKDRFGDKAALTTLVAFLVFPSSFYFLTAFPYALFLFVVLLIFFFLEQKKYMAMILPCGFLAITYPSGIMISLPVIYVLATRWKELTGKQKTALAACLGAMGMSLFLYAGYNWYRFDDFFLYLHFQSQSYYAHEISFPVITIWKSLASLPVYDPISLMLLFVLMIVTLFYSKKIPATWLIFMFGILLFTPTMGTTTSYYRHIVVAFPLYVLVGTAVNDAKRKFLIVPVAIVSVVLMWTVYISAYKNGTLM